MLSRVSGSQASAFKGYQPQPLPVATPPVATSTATTTAAAGSGFGAAQVEGSGAAAPAGGAVIALHLNTGNDHANGAVPVQVNMMPFSPTYHHGYEQPYQNPQFHPVQAYSGDVFQAYPTVAAQVYPTASDIKFGQNSSILEGMAALNKDWRDVSTLITQAQQAMGKNDGTFASFTGALYQRIVGVLGKISIINHAAQAAQVPQPAPYYAVTHAHRGPRQRHIATALKVKFPDQVLCLNVFNGKQCTANKCGSGRAHSEKDFRTTPNSIFKREFKERICEFDIKCPDKPGCNFFHTGETYGLDPATGLIHVFIGQQQVRVLNMLPKGQQSFEMNAT